MITWTVPYRQLSTEQQRAIWFVDGSSLVNGQHPVWKAATFKTSKKTLIEEGLRLHGPETVMTPKQELALCFKHHVRIPKGLMEQDEPSPICKNGDQR